MSEAPAATQLETQTDSFESLDRALFRSGPAALLDELVQRLDERGELRALLDALLLKARFDLGLPLTPDGDLSKLPDALRTQYEDRYIDAVRTVGTKILATGDVAAAWPYFRTIAEPEPIAQAIDAYTPEDGDDERLGAMIDVGFNQGANPRKGYSLLLNHYGICSAITAFEHLPREESLRVACADLLVRKLHEHLVLNLRGDISGRDQPVPPETASIPEILAGRDWLFEDDAYHTDVSHLASIVRIAPLLNDPATISLAIGLTDYGRKLSGRHVYDGDPPFENLYEDHGIYLRALLGRPADSDRAVAHFQKKLVPTDPESPPDSAPAQVLVGLLVRLGRLDDAIAVASEHLAGVPESQLFCPSVAQLCQRTGQSQRLAQIAKGRGDLVQYATAILGQSSTPSKAGSDHRAPRPETMD